MTSTERGSGPAHRPRPPSGEGEPENFSTQIQRIATQRPPPPPGKGIAMMVIAAAVVLAVIYQFTLGSDIGPASVIEDFHRDDPSKTAAPRPAETEGEMTQTAPARAPVASPAPTGESREVVLEEVGRAPSPLPVALPGADLALPEGLDERTAGRLRLNLGALGPRSASIMGRSALRELPFVVRETPDASRDVVARFVVERLVALLARPSLATAALDAGLDLAADGAAELEPLAEAAASTGLDEDRTAAAALLFLDALPPEIRKAYVPRVQALRDAEGRPLHLRRLAGRMLDGWGDV